MPYTSEDVEKEIADFQRCLASQVPPLKVEHAFDLVSFDLDWERGVQRGLLRRRGVYVVYDHDLKVLYVGKATDRFDRRIKGNGTKCRAASVAVIPFPEEYVFLAHALEVFLIARLQPPENTCHVNDYIPPLPGRGDEESDA